MPFVRALKAPISLNCPNQPHKRWHPCTHAYTYIWGHPDPTWGMLELHLFPVLLLAVPALSLRFPRLTSELTCCLVFCWIADYLTVSETCFQPCSAQSSQVLWDGAPLVMALPGLSRGHPKFPVFVDQPHAPCWRNMELASLSNIDGPFGSCLIRYFTFASIILTVHHSINVIFIYFELLIHLFV